MTVGNLEGNKHLHQYHERKQKGGRKRVRVEFLYGHVHMETVIAAYATNSGRTLPMELHKGWKGTTC